MRLIDADALKSALEIEQYNDYDDLLRTERIIDNAPIVERPHGKIITDEDGNTSCSECGQTSVFGNLCYNCCADMREGEEKATCDNCKNKGTDVCESENAKEYGFCGNWTTEEGEAE